MIRTIIMWLIIFVVGSLVVNFIVNPDSYGKFEDRMDNIIKEIKLNQLSDDEIVEAEIVEVPFSDNDLFYSYFTGNSCSTINTISQADDINPNDIKEDFCSSACANNNLEYYHNKCIKDKLHCYCQK